jgi:sigma-E factor negative regulatory protein RseA
MKEKLSALLDGDLERQAGRPVLDGLQKDAGLRKDWDAYHLIGDVLRGEGAGPPDFVARVMAGIDREPTVLVPRAIAAGSPPERSWGALMPVAASVMGVAAVGLVAASLYSGEPGVARVAKVQRVLPSTPVVAQTQRVDRVPVRLSRDERNREYVFAHQSLNMGGPMPGAVQYVRAVSSAAEGSGR